MASPILYLSPPAPVSMSDWYYDLASTEHFWVRRRFDVLTRLGDDVFRNARSAAEIGCGHGVLQRQVEDHYGIPVMGFELNKFALEKSISRLSPLCCYDIHQRCAEFKSKFDLIFLCDVLEHIPDEVAFLESVKYHLAPFGVLVINVPAFQMLYSQYDRTVGHFRRYTITALKERIEASGLRIRNWTYWGLPLAPLLLGRKLATGMRTTENQVVDSGFKPPGGSFGNKALRLLSRCEWIPQSLFGTSLTAFVEKPD
ncbi:MAG: methyltransferase [Terriglobia bacterium]|nr:MAG: methyltransferase [Terriglobia bacterium]